MKKLHLIIYGGWLAIMVTAIYYLDNTTVDYSHDSRVQLEQRKVDCSQGQIPVDCVKANKPAKRHKKPKDGSVVR